MNTPFPGPRSSHEQEQPEPAPQQATSTRGVWGRFGGEHGWLARRVHDVRTAPAHGWPLMATWIKTLIIIGATAGAVLALRWTGALLIGWGHALPWPLPADDDHTGLLATIDQPVRHYLATHTTSLPVSVTTAYATWQAVGAGAFALGYLHSAGARLTWTLWGALTVAMTWYGTPAPGRQVAAGIALLAWAALSVLALRGLSLTPAVYVDITPPAPPAPEIRAEIHLPKTQPAAYTPNTPDQQQLPSVN
ncbi:hypothetical protein [Streptomyces sp. NPDC093109]|uniref:hypothetical protein n=1 Tax=Streptomyces sp. NPDC093109 TaxID=3154977 RepID=UPI00344F8AF6